MERSEVERVREVYSGRDAAGRETLYGWHRPEVLLQKATYARLVATIFHDVFGTDIGTLSALDVGCGTGGFLSLLVGWGCDPALLAGTELLVDRLERAKQVSAPGITWHLGDLQTLSATEFDLVAAHTVFSSILDQRNRRSLAQEMLRKTRRGGWILIFDFRYNNPHNPNVLRVVRSELEGYFSPARSIYRTMHLAPPVARRLAPLSPVLCDLLSLLAPLLRSHFVLMMQKG